MNTRRRLTLGLAALAVILSAGIVARWPLALWGQSQGQAQGGPASKPVGAFQVEPYLQPGDGAEVVQRGCETLALLWQTEDHDAAWSVAVGRGPGEPWVTTAAPSARRVAVDGVPPFRLYRATLAGLAPGSSFRYRVSRGGVPVFEAEAQSHRLAGQPHRFVTFGDCAADTVGQRAVAYQTFLARPDYLVVTGDIVYSRGRVSEYLDHFFPIYNAAKPAAEVGAPLLRSVVAYAAPGNHDLMEGDLDKHPDGLAYFYYWDQPRNGPLTAADAPGAPRLKGSDARRRAFLEAAGPAFPRMASFSFDVGDVHWTVLDSDNYADWTTPALRDWLEADLASPAAKKAAWRLAAYHHPAFHSSKAHKDDQRMRLVAPVLERGKVDVVFSGHVHNYQRTRPMRFTPGPPPADGKGTPYGPDGQVPGTWTLDTTYDGVNQTRPDGVIHVVNGAGGARLYDPAQQDDPASWQSYTTRFVSKVHSLTVVDVTPTALTVRQIADDGRELDRFIVTR